MSTKTNLNSWLQKAAATESSRPVLTWQYSDGRVSMTADGYRAHLVWDAQPAGFTALKKSVPDGNQGKFPDVLAIVPRQPAHTITVHSDDLQRALKIVHSFRDGNYSAVHLTFDAASIHGGQLILSTRNPERGDVQTALPYYGTMPHDPGFQFNLHYLLDAASGFADNLYIGLNGPNDPVVIGEFGKQLTVIMPMGTEAHHYNHEKPFDAEAIIATQRTQTQPDGEWTPFYFPNKKSKKGTLEVMSPTFEKAIAKFDTNPLTESGRQHLDTLIALDSQFTHRQAYGLAAAQRRKTLSAANRPDDLPTGGRMDAVVVIESPLKAVDEVVERLVSDAAQYRRPLYAAFNPTNGALYLQTKAIEGYRIYVNGHTSIQTVQHGLKKPYHVEVGFGSSVPYAVILKEFQTAAQNAGVEFRLVN